MPQRQGHGDQGAAADAWLKQSNNKSRRKVEESYKEASERCMLTPTKKQCSFTLIKDLAQRNLGWYCLLRELL